MINKDRLIKDLVAKMGCTTGEAENFLDAFKETMKDYLAAGETIKIKEWFKAEVRNYKGHIARNPKTDELVEVPDRKKVKFTVSPIFNKMVNGK